MKIDGFLDPTHPLSPRAAFKGLDRGVKLLVDYPPRPRWEADTALLPPALGRWRRQCRDFAEAVLRPHVLAADRNEHGPETREVLDLAARAGLITDLLPWPLGSVPVARARFPMHWTASLKMEELCAVCGGLGLAIGVHALGALPILLSGSLGTIRRFLLPAQRANRTGAHHLFAFAITEPSGGSDVEDSEGAVHYTPRTVAARVPGGWSLKGRKVFITGGDLASAVTVFAALEGEGMASWTCFLVERGTAGFDLGRNELKMGQRASSATELVFDDVFVPDSHVVGALRQGWAINRATLNFSRIPIAAIALGIARGALESAIDFACRTRLAGRLLVTYQDVQLRLAQMMIDTSAMRAMVWQSASTWTPLQGRASATKVFCSDTSVKVCESAMELLGDHGYLHHHLVEKTYRDARLTQIYEGTNQINRLAIIEDAMEELDARCD